MSQDSGAFGHGAGGVDQSKPDVAPFSMNPCSMTNIHASSRAFLHILCGCRSSLSAGYALSTFIVVACSLSYAFKKCCFGVTIVCVAMSPPSMRDEPTSIGTYNAIGSASVNSFFCDRE